MAIRIRKSGTIICAAKSGPKEGDIYLDDAIHYRLAVEMVVLSVCGYHGEADLWEFHKPMTLANRIDKEALVKKKFGII